MVLGLSTRYGRNVIERTERLAELLHDAILIAERRAKMPCCATCGGPDFRCTNSARSTYPFAWIYYPGVSSRGASRYRYHERNSQSSSRSR